MQITHSASKAVGFLTKRQKKQYSYTNSKFIFLLEAMTPPGFGRSTGVGADCAYHIETASPRIFRPSYGPVIGQ